MSDIDYAVPIAAGGAHTLAVLDDGTVKAWGEDYNGQLGDGFNNNSKNLKSRAFITMLQEVRCQNA